MLNENGLDLSRSWQSRNKKIFLPITVLQPCCCCVKFFFAFLLKFMNHGVQSIKQPAAVNEKQLCNEDAHYVYQQIK